jgi:hypothetical protein
MEDSPSRKKLRGGIGSKKRGTDKCIVEMRDVINSYCDY